MQSIWARKIMVFAVIMLFVVAGFISNVISMEQALGNTIYVDDDADPAWYDATHVKTIQEGGKQCFIGRYCLCL
jgi:hypothetical protein